MSFFEFPHTRTYDSDLGWLIKDYKTLDDAIKALNEWKETTDPTISELKELYTQLLNGDLSPAMEEALEKWLRDNFPNLLSTLIKFVFFGITDDGYFVAYIPDSWSDIIFGTSGLDDFPSDVEFGHLTLTY